MLYSTFYADYSSTLHQKKLYDTVKKYNKENTGLGSRAPSACKPQGNQLLAISKISSVSLNMDIIQMTL